MALKVLQVRQRKKIWLLKSLEYLVPGSCRKWPPRLDNQPQNGKSNVTVFAGDLKQICERLKIKFCKTLRERTFKPFPPSDGHPVSPTMIGKDRPPILSRATLQPLSMFSNKEPRVPNDKSSGRLDEKA